MATGLAAETPRRRDETFFERPQTPGKAPPMLSQVENGIADQLPGAVIGDVAATVGLENFSAQGRQALARNEQVLTLGIPPQLVNVRVLEQQKRIGNLAGLALGHALALELERVGVGHRPALFNQAEHLEKVNS